MPYTVSIKPKAEKYLSKLTDKRLFRRLREAISRLAQNPRPPGSLKMHGGADLHRARVGDYRIIYEIHDTVLVVVVVKIGDRREIYRD